jgi:hypothetical protein
MHSTRPAARGAADVPRVRVVRRRRRRPNDRASRHRRRRRGVPHRRLHAPALTGARTRTHAWEGPGAAGVAGLVVKTRLDRRLRCAGPVCVCVRARACARARVRVRVCLCVCVRACVCACDRVRDRETARPAAGRIPVQVAGGSLPGPQAASGSPMLRADSIRPGDSDMRRDPSQHWARAARRPSSGCVAAHTTY